MHLGDQSPNDTDADALRTGVEEWRHRLGPVPPAATDSGIPVEPVYTPLDVNSDSYLDNVGLPGEMPFVRGIYPSMYRGRMWTMRLYSGWGTAEDTNQRFRYLLAHGQTGLSVALDLPTQMGLDSDHPQAAPEVGKVGVAISSLADMEQIFRDIPLSKVSTSFTINATAPILLAMYQAVGEQQGVPPDQLRGTVQNDILKEYLARKTYIFPPRPSLRLVTDTLEYCAIHLPRFNPISVCGYHMRQAGCDAVQEIALTLAHAAAYLTAVVERGVPVDQIAPRFSFNLSTMRDFFEEIAKHRAARRLWARIVSERFAPRDPRSLQLRLFSGGDGTSLTAVEPLNNVVRITLQALAIALSGAQAVHTIAYDEALGLPTDESALLALRTQQIIGYEAGVARTADPLGGSYFLESLTNTLEQRAEALLLEIERRGVLAGIEDGSLEQMIADAAYEREQSFQSGSIGVVGVNMFVEDSQTQDGQPNIFMVDDSVRLRQLARLDSIRQSRDSAQVGRALAHLAVSARGTNNLMPAISDAVRAYATVGEITAVLSDAFGRHEGTTVV